MGYRMIRREDYKDEPIQWVGYYVLKVKDFDLPEPDVFFVEDEEYPPITTQMPIHLDLNSDCCGFFNMIRKEGLFCNECGINIIDAIRNMKSAYGNQKTYQSDIINRAVILLKRVVDIKKYQNKSSIANQGQCLDGYAALANYNNIAEKIETFLREEGL